MITNRRGIPLAVLVIASLTTVLALQMLGAMPASARASSQDPQVTHIVVNGKSYSVALGAELKLPITYPDGSHGVIGFMAGASDPTSSHEARGSTTPYDTGCPTVHAWITYYNGFGDVLASYTLYQYFCYDSSIDTITDWHNAYPAIYTAYGWSVADHGEISYVNPPSSAGHGEGSYRFNGPFGFGCESGHVDIYFYGDGYWSPNYVYGGYYGC